MTGIKLPGGVGVTWEYEKDEKLIASTLLTFLENKRILFHPYVDRCPGNAIISVLELRKRIQSDMEQLDRNTYLHKTLSLMRNSINLFLEYASANCESVTSCKDCRVRKTGCLKGLIEFRKEMGRCIAGICISFDLDVEEQLATIMPLNVDNKLLKTRPGMDISILEKLFEWEKGSRDNFNGPVGGPLG